jgi:tetratricopeptide (TPR) repeat protein
MESLSALAKPLISVGKALVPLVKRLQAERKAGADSANIKSALLDSVFDETLNRLEDIEAQDSWWRELLLSAGTAYVRPAYLTTPSVRAWLREAAVRNDLKALARVTLLPGSADRTAIRRRLADRYAQHTGEAARLARGRIDAVINILLAGTLALASKGELVVAGLIQESHTDLSARLASIEGRIGALGPDEFLAKAITEKAQAVLDSILRRRSIPTVDALGEIVALAGRLDNRGDLQFCAKPVQLKIYLWAARLHAQNSERIAAAREFRAKALAIDAAADTKIIDAWVSANSGDVVGGLGGLRDLHTPDARSNLLGMLSLHQGKQHALEWLDANGSSDTKLLTAVGWKNAAALLAEAGRWEEAAARLKALPEDCIVDCPDIPFVDGFVNAALTLPLFIRARVLTVQVFEKQIEALQGAEVAGHRLRALRCFDVAKQLLSDLGEKVRAAGAETWRAWLLLNEPSSRQEGERIVTEAMRDGAKAVDYVQLAYTFGIPFDSAPLEHYLAIRELAGGLSPPEVAAKLAIYRHTRSKPEVVSFVERERNSLSTVVTAEGYWALLVIALVEAGQIERAEQMLNDHREDLGDDFERLKDQIRLRRGEDVLQSFETRFLETDADIDLMALCDNLAHGEDVDKLRRYAIELFRRQKNVRNAHRVCDALTRMDRHRELVDFLGDADDLVEIDNDLALVKGWSLLHLGRLIEAKLIDEQLRRTRKDPNDVRLEITLALATGTWEEFADILSREWRERDKREPRYLLQLARLVGDIDKDRALELAREATRKAPDNPDVLGAASLVAYRLGHDEQATPWMVEAARLSPPDGPVKTGGIRDLVDFAMAAADTTRGVQEAVSTARVPLHMAAPFWKMPLTRLFVSQPHDNERERDPRRRTVIPIRHGVRGILDMSPVKTIAADVTSLLLLTELDLLRVVERRFERIGIAWSTMELLLTEIQSCRFHQPSRIAAAKKLRELIVNNNIGTLLSSAEPPLELVHETGPVLAELLQAAKQTSGRVVRPLPIYRVQSFMQQNADLGEYASVVMTTLQFVDALEAEAVLDGQTSECARQMLTPLEVGEPLGTSCVGEGPVFLDGLALAYLYSAGLLDDLHRSDREFRIHRSTATEIEQLIQTEAEADRAIEVLTRLRIWLRDGIAAGRVIVMPRPRPFEEEDLGVQTRVLQELVSDIGTADAVLIDDRMVGSQGRVTDRSGRAAPIVDTLDLLHDLAGAGLLSPRERFHAHHVLRARGFMCIPLELEEIEGYLATRGPDGVTGRLVENAELRAIRENLQRLRSTTIVQQPAETPYLDRMRLTGFIAMRNVWQDNSIPIPTAVARTEWLWHNLMSTPIDWAHTIIDSTGVIAPRAGFMNEASSLLLAILTPDLERAQAFRKWVETTVLAPLEMASPDILDDLAGFVHSRIRGFADEWTSKNHAD